MDVIKRLGACTEMHCTKLFSMHTLKVNTSCALHHCFQYRTYP